MLTTLLTVIPIVIILILVYLVARATKMTLIDFVILIAGLITGLIVGALLSIPVSKIGGTYANILPLSVTLLSSLAILGLFYSQREALASWLGHGRLGASSKPSPTPPSGVKPILVDTSVIIDGRIADIAQTGFVPGKLLVPRFVLAELQNIADSDDSLRRGRGRRGLEMLNNIQSTPGIDFEVIDDDVPETKEVDAKLVALGKRLNANIMTTDFNLNRVAQIEGVRVLNINELNNAIRPVVLPGEEMAVKIVQAGKERNQGVGYLPDGTMIVVENGDRMIGQEVPVEVSRVFQTVAGKMIFATPAKSYRPAPAEEARSQRQPQRNKAANGRPKGDHRGNRPSDIETRLVQDNRADDSSNPQSN